MTGDLMGMILVFGCGVIFTLLIMFMMDDSLSKLQVEDYYKMKTEREYFKRLYTNAREVLMLIEEDDVEMMKKDNYNHFVLKKEKMENDREMINFNDILGEL